jgi:hypothetical protein
MWLPVVFFCAAGSCQFWSDAAYTNKQECLQAVEKILDIMESYPETTVAGQCLQIKQRFTLGKESQQIMVG